MRILLTFAALLLVGCEQDYAEVQCTGSGDGSLSCAVHHTKGSKTIDVCFDMVIQCRNGATATAHACQKSLAPSAMAMRVLRDEDFSNVAKCDQTVGSSVSNLKITESP